MQMIFEVLATIRQLRDLQAIRSVDIFPFWPPNELEIIAIGYSNRQLIFHLTTKTHLPIPDHVTFVSMETY